MDERRAKSARIEELANALLSQNVSAAEIHELEDLLRGDPDSCRWCRDFIAQDAALRYLLTSQIARRQALAAVAPLNSPPQRAFGGLRLPALNRSWAFSLVTATSVVWMVLGLLALVQSSSDEAAPSPPIVARLTNLSEPSVDEPPSSSPPRALRVGEPLHWAAGKLEARFHHGVRVVIEGPARLTALSETRLALESGRLLAQVDHRQVENFTVETPLLTAVDWGTEFGVDVDPQRTQVHVFQGRVAVHLTATQDSRQLTKGEGVLVAVDHPREFQPGPTRDGFAALQTPRAEMQMRTLYVQNGGFEDSPSRLKFEGAEGIYRGVPLGWRRESGSEVCGVFNPDDTYYLGAGDARGAHEQATVGVEGKHIAFIWGSGPMSWTQRLAGEDQVVDSADDPVLEGGAIYRLQARIGSRSNQNLFAGGRLELLAGNQGIATREIHAPPSKIGRFGLVSAVVRTPKDHPQIGQPLTIRISKFASPGVGYFDIDAVQLDVGEQP